MRQKKIAVSIINYNSLQDLSHIVPRLDSALCDIFILDNASAHREGEKLNARYQGFDHIFVHENSINLWFAGGNNKNLDIIRQTGNYTYILLLNPDTYFEKEFLSIFFQGIEQHPVDLCCPVIHTTFARQKRKQYGGKISLRLGMTFANFDPTRQEYEYLPGSCLCIRESMIWQTFLDEHFFLYREEVDRCFTQKKEWINLQVIKNAEITHKQNYLNKLDGYYQYIWNRNRLIFCKKHAKRYHIPTIALRTVLLLLFFIFQSRGKAVQHVFKGVRHGLTGEMDRSYFR